MASIYDSAFLEEKNYKKEKIQWNKRTSNKQLGGLVPSRC